MFLKKVSQFPHGKILTILSVKCACGRINNILKMAKTLVLAFFLTLIKSKFLIKKMSSVKIELHLIFSM